MVTISMLGKIGFKNPESVLAQFVLYTPLGIGLFFLLNWMFSFWWGRFTHYKLDIEDRKNERLRIMQSMQKSVVADSRTVDPKTKRRNALIIALMTDALIANDCNFSYRKAGAYILAGETKALGKDSKAVADALEWLRINGAVEGNSLSGKYQSIGDVQRGLYSPILGGAK